LVGLASNEEIFYATLCYEEKREKQQQATNAIAFGQVGACANKE